MMRRVRQQRRHHDVPQHRHRRRGYTLVEMMVALMLLSVGILSLSSTSSLVVRTMGESNKQVLAATMARSRLERLAGLGCSASGFVSGSAVTNGISETWVVANGGGANTAISAKRLTDSVTYTTRRGLRFELYSTVVVC